MIESAWIFVLVISGVPFAGALILLVVKFLSPIIGPGGLCKDIEWPPPPSNYFFLENSTESRVELPEVFLREVKTSDVLSDIGIKKEDHV